MSEPINASREVQIDKILQTAVNRGASDIHIKVGYPPILRVNGDLVTLKTGKFDAQAVDSVAKGLLSEHKQVEYGTNRNVDASVTWTEHQGETCAKTHRFRLNAAYDESGPYLTLRLIPDKILSVQEIGFPYDVWKDIIKLRRGMVLVTGITGSGKTTTLASLIQEINLTRSDHVVTLEDPVEYMYTPQRCIISQRELGESLHSFGDGVKYALRQDPDIILIGEIRDRETAEKALEAAATGHLVFSTLHTSSAAETVRRYVDLFPSSDHENVRGGLAANLAYVLCQQLIPYVKGAGRVLAMEVMNVHGSSGVQNHLRREEYKQLPSDMQTGRQLGMTTMDQHLEQLNKQGKISLENAVLYAHNPEQLRKALESP